MSIMIDTSVWVDFFRDVDTPEVRRLDRFIHQNEVLLISDLILTEILQGVKTERELAQVDAAFRAYRVVPMVGETIARQSALYYRQLRRRGITVRKTVDCLIATWCIYNQVPLLHADRDFRRFIHFGLQEA